MSGWNTAVFGLYPDHSGPENGVETLKQVGFPNTDISVLFPENVGSKDFGHEKRTKAPEGAATGAGSGAVLGGALEWTKRAKEILEQTGAQDISSSAEASADYARSDRPAGRTASDVEAVLVRSGTRAEAVAPLIGPSALTEKASNEAARRPPD